MSTALKLLLRLVIFLSSRHRTIGIRDWLAAFIATIALGVGFVILVVLHLAPAATTREDWICLALAVALVVYIALIPVFFVVKLRRNGITDADFSIEGGLDYKTALRTGRGGFSFMGVGGAKLTQMNNDFRSAVQSARKSQKPIRMLLVDATSPAIKTLEHSDGDKAYSIEIENSMRFIQSIANSNDDVISVRTHLADSRADLRPFRLFFADEDCLVSPFVSGTGTINRGRQLPQIRITSAGWPQKDAPTMYVAFERYFDANWKDQENNAVVGRQD